MDDQEFMEGFLALYGFLVFIVLVLLGTMIVSSSPDSYSYVDYEPPIDLVILAGLLIADLFVLTYLLLQSLKFGTSKNLNYRPRDLQLALDKMKIFSLILLVPLLAGILYFTIKYFESSITIYLVALILLSALLLGFIIFMSVSLKKDLEQDKKDKFEWFIIYSWKKTP